MMCKRAEKRRGGTGVPALFSAENSAFFPGETPSLTRSFRVVSSDQISPSHHPWILIATPAWIPLSTTRKATAVMKVSFPSFIVVNFVFDFLFVKVDALTALEFSGDGEYLATGDRNGRVTVLRMEQSSSKRDVRILYFEG